VSRFLRASLGADFGYMPGEQPSDTGGWLKLNSNESPLPPSLTVAAAVAGAAADLARYPSPVAEPLRSALAHVHALLREDVTDRRLVGVNDPRDAVDLQRHGLVGSDVRQWSGDERGEQDAVQSQGRGACSHPASTSCRSRIPRSSGGRRSTLTEARGG